MWKILIKTNLQAPKEINLIVEDYNSPEVQEILEQPYVTEVRMEQINKAPENIRRLKK